MIEVVLDASALLAYLREEPGSDRVDEVLAGAVITSVNWAEVVQPRQAAQDRDEPADQLQGGLLDRQLGGGGRGEHQSVARGRFNAAIGRYLETAGHRR